ncbi:stage III sporulation protein AE [Alicyclobacillus sp. ALC3]|uniref:stage III sporulation protein AE n=1 Tax=Alicyclobacillus sp. ALC3 TaxID=2796143 RepID=UPI002377FAD9|nr:stage III sporulation protein AE [Alicyclobacillus sp. ALC3]WDL97021.1 stage III sporulation protein AE [Alicyclobacillus sp. ALC3]
MRTGKTWRSVISAWLLCLVVVCFGFTLGTSVASAQTSAGATPAATVQQDANQQLDSLPIGAINKFWDSLQQQYGGYLPDAGGTSLVRDIVDSGGVNLHGIVHGLLKYLFDALIDNAALLGGVIMLSVFAAVLESMQTAFEQQTVSQAAYAMIFMVLLVLTVGSFTEAIGYAKHAIQAMNDFMLASVPVLTGLLAASGAIASAAFFHPLVVVAVEVVSNVVFIVVFPLIFFSAVLDIVSALSPRYKLTRLAGLLRSGGAAVLGLSMSVFLGITAVQGAGRGIADGVALRTVKFSVSTFVPIVGKAVSDAAETIASASLLVKNAVGIAGLIIVASIALFPAIKVLAVSLVYSGSAALMQPLGAGPIVDCLGALGKSLLYVFGSVVVVAMMFFIFICILLASANLAVVMG